MFELMKFFFGSHSKSGQLAGERGGGLPYPFLKIGKKCPDFAKRVL